MIKKSDKKITINNKWYLDLDKVIRPNSCPNVTDMLIESYNFFRHSCSIRTFDLNGTQILDTWFCDYNKYSLETNANIFKAELKNNARSPYWILTLREGGHDSYIYDAVNTPSDVWKSIKWKSELKKIWSPFIDWVELLPVKYLGHVSFFINRPNVVPYYHVDSGQDSNLELWEPSPHREEFIWINFNKEKTFYILDNDAQPVKINSTSAFFNTNNFHGSHEATHSWTYSVRIECAFNDELRKQLNISHLERYYYE